MPTCAMSIQPLLSKKNPEMQFPDTHPLWDALFAALRLHNSRAAYALVYKRWLCQIRVYPDFPVSFSPPLIDIDQAVASG